ncbi:MAG: O-antigen ligase family protein [Paracoccaceae bacterium]
MTDIRTARRQRASRGRPQSPPASEARGGFLPPLPVTLFLLGLVLPAIFFIGTLRLAPYRLVLLVMVLPVLFLWLAGRAGPRRLADICILLIPVWGAVSFFKLYGVSSATIQQIGIHFVETVGSYLLARCYIRTPDDFRNFVRLLFWIIVALLPLAVYETMTGNDIVLDFFRKFTRTFGNVYKPPRWGFDRVQGPFEHPILFGVFAGAGLALSYFVLGYGAGLIGRLWKAGMVFTVSALSFSSGPLSALATQIGLIVWDRMFRQVANRWWLLFFLFVLAYIVVDLLSNRTPPAVFISYAAFNPATAYNRLRIFDYGWLSVMKHPFFGIGLGYWARPSWMSGSVDMFWLLNFMRYGFPVGILHLANFFLIFLGVIFRKGLDARAAAYREGFLICLAGFFVAGWTVHYWNALYVFLMFILGSGVWMLDHDSDAGDAGIETPDRPARRARARPERRRELPRRRPGRSARS